MHELSFLSMEQRIEELIKNPKLAKGMRWDKLGTNDWRELLPNCPELGIHCNWEEISGWSTVIMVALEPKLSKFCDFNKLDDEDWTYLLNHRPEFSEFRT